MTTYQERLLNLARLLDGYTLLTERGELLQATGLLALAATIGDARHLDRVVALEGIMRREERYEGEFDDTLYGLWRAEVWPGHRTLNEATERAGWSSWARPSLSQKEALARQLG